MSDQNVLLENEKKPKILKTSEISTVFYNAYLQVNTANSISAILIGHNGKGKLGHKNSNIFIE